MSFLKKSKAMMQMEDIPDKKPFHPKLFLKNAQRRLQTSPYLYLIFCFFIPVIIMYGIYVIKGIYPIFSDGSPLVLDLNHQYVSFFEALRDFALGERSILYSFSRSLGGEFMGMVAYYMASPLTYITVLFPKERIQEAVLAILLLKCGLSGLSFGFYLHKKSRNPKKLTILAFSLLYALSAYSVVQQQNTMWIEALIWLPLLAYGIENLVYRKKYKLYVIALSVIMICNYYIGFMICIFSVLYFFFCYFSKSKEEINPYKEKLHFLRAGARFAIFSLISAAISAFMLIAAFYSLQFGKTDFSSPSWDMQMNFGIVDFLTKFLPGAYDTLSPPGLPFIYCGILTLFLVPIYFISKKISSREKIASLALLSVLILSLFIRPLDLIWHGFSMPNWINARYSFILCFVLLVLAYKALGNLKSANEKVILCIAAFIIFFAAVAEKFELEAYINSDKKLLLLGCILFAIAFAIIIAVILCLKLKKGNKKFHKGVSAVLVGVICLELFCNGVVCFLKMHEDVGFTNYKRYNENLADFRPLISEIKEKDSSFFRMEKTYARTKNDNMALGMYGITNSTSTLNAKAISFIHDLGYNGRSHYTMYKGGTAAGDSLLGIKYVIDYESSTVHDKIYKKLDIGDGEKYCVYENPNALSLAYGVDEKLKDFSLDDYDNFFNRYNGLLSAMLGEDDEDVLLFRYSFDDPNVISEGCTNDSGYIYYKYAAEDDDAGTLTFEYTAPEAGYYYFYPHGSATDKVTLTDLGDFQNEENNYIFKLGYFEANETIPIVFHLKAGVEISLQKSYNMLWYFSIDDYNEIFSKLKNNPQLDISTESTEDHLFGSIRTKQEDQTVLTTIPYDKGWNVYIDGKKTETYETLDALMAFDIADSGKHFIEMKYMPNAYIIGFAISIFGITAFLLLCAADFVLKRTLLKNKLHAYEKDYFILYDVDSEGTDEPAEPIESNKAGLEAPEPNKSDSSNDENNSDCDEE